MVKLDIVFVCITLIVIVSISTISIINSIDNKLSNISVNIPPINIPKSTVIINLDKGKTIKAEIDLNKEKEDVIEPLIEGFDAIKQEIKENKIKEPKCKQKVMKPNKINCKGDFKSGKQYSVVKPIVGQLEDYKMKGSNYIHYNDVVSPKDVGMRLLPSHNKKLYPHKSSIPKYPQAKNYIFI